tara:strand:- start:2529 stop:4058 length:1530 start_codon:yes stop_codon:yes gene_type:complete
MYFGSRLLNGELIWTKEFDDKSPVLQYIFSLAAAFKNTNIFVLLTLIISVIAAYLGFRMLRDILRNSSLEINQRSENKILYFGTILYLTLLACIYGSLHHINAISSSLCLIAICISYFNWEKDRQIKTNLAAICSAISISIRPYYILNIITIPLWLYLRQKKDINNDINPKGKSINYSFIGKQAKWIILIIGYILVLNLTPYLISGNLTDFYAGIKLNSIDYINHNILTRQFINIGRNPILYPIILGLTILPLIRIIFNKAIYKYHLDQKKGLINLYKLDIDILFFGIVNPILLQYMFYRKHFFGHYFTLFTPYIFISIVLLISILTRLDKIIYNYRFLKTNIRILFTLVMLICLVTNQSIPRTIKEITNKNITEKEYKVELIKEFIKKETNSTQSFKFFAPEDNYLHWRLHQPRHGFPQTAVFRNIAKGKMDNVIDKNNDLNYNFILPKKKDLCKTVIQKSPEYIITENNDYTFICLSEHSSKYKLIDSNQNLPKRNIYIFKRIPKQK